MSLAKKLRLLAFSIGLIYFYFGLLKVFPSISPAEEIGIMTVNELCLGIFPEKFCIYSLAAVEIFIGLLLIFNKFLKLGIIMAIGHLLLTFAPLILFPDQTFNQSYLSPSLLGQYIFKNIVLIMALIVLYPGKNLRLEARV